MGLLYGTETKWPYKVYYGGSAYNNGVNIVKYNNEVILAPLTRMWGYWSSLKVGGQIGFSVTPEYSTGQSTSHYNNLYLRFRTVSRPAQISPRTYYVNALETAYAPYLSLYGWVIEEPQSGTT